MPVPTRTSADANASADINSLQTQIISLSASYTLSTPGTDQTLTSASVARQSMAPSVDISVTLDNSFSAGAFIELHNTSSTKVITLKSNDGSTICKVIPLSWLIIMSKQSTPTATTHWSTKSAGGGWATVTTVTTQGLGTIGTTSIKVRRVGGSLEYEGILTTGTTTASEARWGFPFSLTSTSTISTLELAGDLITDTIGATIAYYLLREPSVTYFTFGYNIGTTDAYAKANGNDLSNSSVLSFRASTPISGWELNG